MIEIQYGGESTENNPIAERLFNLDKYIHEHNGIRLSSVFHCLYLTGIAGMKDNEYCKMRSRNRLCCGKESGFTVLSKIGFLNYEEDIQKRFLFLQSNPSARNRSPQGSWEDFKSDVLAFFCDVTKESNKYAKQLEKKAQKLSEDVKKYL